MLRIAPRKVNSSVLLSCQRYYNEHHGNLPQSARVVIAGSGAVANAVAYHLTKQGWSDVLVLEQNTIKSGTSHFSTGLIGLLKPFSMRKVIEESLTTYRELETLGYDLGLKRCGSINLAQTQDRMIALKRRMSYSQVEGLECELLEPNEIQRLHPYVSTEGLLGAVYVPDDCYVDASKLCDALIDVAIKSGVQYREHCQVKYVLTDSQDGVCGVDTDLGTVKCEYFVNAAGMWSRELGFKCDKTVRIPTCSAEHYYLTTRNLSIPENYNLPCIRDYDNSHYSRQMDDELLIGWYEGEGQTAFEKTVPRNWMKDLQGHEHVHLEKVWDRLLHRYPVLNDSDAPTVRVSANTFTPDSRWIMGEAPGVDRYFACAGTNGNTFQGAGGMGKYVSEWIVSGRPTTDLFPFSIQRFHALHNNRNYLQQRVREIVGKHYQIQYPNQSEYQYARKLRTSPLYSVLELRGGVFGTKMAYERALYFDTTYRRGEPLPSMPKPTFFKPPYFNFMVDENAACRETVGIIDISSFSKIKISSSSKTDVVNYLQNVCCNNADIEIETCMKTGMLNKNGGYENECIIVRQTPTTFFMISPSSQQTKILEWMTDNLPKNNRTIKLSDHTSSYTVLNVTGPKAHSMISELTNSDINLKHFRYKQINIGFASEIMVMKYSHTGDTNGYCLYIPSEYALHVYDELTKVGIDYGAKDVGTITQRSMRVERFIPLMGDELTSDVTPLEAGQDHYIDFSKEFLGKAALLKQKESGLKKRLVLLMLEDFDVEADIWPWGSEPIFRNSEYVGNVTTACYGFLSGKMVCLGYVDGTDNVTRDYILEPGTTYHIDIANRFFEATPYVNRKDLPYLKEKQDEMRATNFHQKASVFREKKKV
ncbi:pyruvate dehydrogenase phosphatase regulatory subunit, mitochondrial-like [Chironomus tepperi]|uniref:pyruvate dehydrogenase phosphatase regulatory subunit, mitochondrial-like n=1 Tax=Chironomus tepperi TaxID=113505 RepID=UPI00391FA13A